MSAVTDIADWSPLRGPAYEGQFFEAIVLASKIDQLDDLDPSTPNTLVATTEWLVWWTWRQKGGQVIHLDRYLIGWTHDEFGAADTLYHDAGTWTYIAERDATTFRGISLGRQFDSEITTADYLFRRLHSALSELTNAVSCRTIELRGLRAYNKILDDDVIRLMVGDVARSHGVDVTDMLDSRDPQGDNFQDSVLFASTTPSSENPLITFARKVLTRLAEPLSEAFWLLQGKKPKVFFVLSELGLRGMIMSGVRLPFSPVIAYERSSKSPKFLLQCLRQSVVLAHLPQIDLGTSDRAAVTAIQDTIRNHWSQNPPQTVRDEALRYYVEHRLFQSGKLERMAAFALRNIAMFKRHRFARTVICDIRTSVSRIPAELSKAAGLSVDELPNGIFVTPLKDIGRCGDTVNAPLVDRYLSWGEAFLPWFERITGRAVGVVAGYPAVDFLTRLADRPVSPRAFAPAEARKILLLTTYSGIADAKAIRSNTVTYLVAFLDELNCRGYEVRIKGHPGADCPEYFDSLAKRLDLDATVAGKFDPLADHVGWADMVIGPVSSGALVETLALGKPYIGLVPHESSIELDYFEGFPIIRDPKDFDALVKENTTIVPAQLLYKLCQSDPDGCSTTLLRDALKDVV